jgi:hypothetical protein
VSPRAIPRLWGTSQSSPISPIRYTSNATLAHSQTPEIPNSFKIDHIRNHSKTDHTRHYPKTYMTSSTIPKPTSVIYSKTSEPFSTIPNLETIPHDSPTYRSAAPIPKRTDQPHRLPNVQINRNCSETYDILEHSWRSTTIWSQVSSSAHHSC